MKIQHSQIVAGALLATYGALAMAQTSVGVSWSNFQQERWKTDEGGPGQPDRVGLEGRP